MTTYETASEADTMAFAGALAHQLAAGDTVLIQGDLGAGKSVFTRGLGRALGVTGPMPSPTFTMLIPHRGRLPFYHYDLYRLSDEDEFYAAGLDEFIGGDGVAAVEWPEMADLHVTPSLQVTICRGSDDSRRVIAIENHGVAGYDPRALAQWRNAN